MAGIGHNRPPTQGYILIFRSLLNHPVVGAGKPVKPAKPSKPTYSRLEAWLDLLMMAVYDDKTVRMNGFNFDLKRGENVCATSYLSERWNWSEKSIRGFLSRLQKHEMILKKGAPKGQAKGKRPNHLSICNYLEYQDGAQYMEFEKGKQEGKQPVKKEGKQESDITRCKLTENLPFDEGEGQVNRQAKGQAKGPHLKQTKTNKPKIDRLDNLDSSESSLNGSSNQIIADLSVWIYKNSFEGAYEPNNPPLPMHIDDAKRIIKSFVVGYGAEAVKKAHSDMLIKMATGGVIGNPLPLFRKMVEDHKAKAKNTNSSARKKIEAIMGAEH
jgi:hypothetical protein